MARGRNAESAPLLSIYDGQIPITILYYRGFEFPVLQVVTPDAAGRFRWEPDWDSTAAAKQPVVGQPPA
jgi:hypothetical protein